MEKNMLRTELDTSSIIEAMIANEIGQAVGILPDLFAIKIRKQRYRVGNGYVLRHLNQRDLLLIDCVHQDSKETLMGFKAKGYRINGLLLTHGDLVDQAYTDLKTLSQELEAPIFVHPFDSGNQADAVQDITGPHEVLDHFSIRVRNYPGHTGGSVLLYTDINGGMLFTGDCAVGAPYESDSFYFERPPIGDANKDSGLAANWKRFTFPFKHLLPLHGKPQFYLTEGSQTEIILQLSKDAATRSL